MCASRLSATGPLHAGVPIWVINETGGPQTVTSGAVPHDAALRAALALPLLALPRSATLRTGGAALKDNLHRCLIIADQLTSFSADGAVDTSVDHRGPYPRVVFAHPGRWLLISRFHPVATYLEVLP